MNYRFNFSFLHDWFNANKVTKKEICLAVENTDFTSVNRWINGEQTMPTDSILRFCNYFSVPLECFFLDYDAKPTLDIRQPAINDQTEPAGGYPQGRKKRGQHGVNPATSTKRTSILPYVLITPKEDGVVEIEEKVLECDGEEKPITVIGLESKKECLQEEQTTASPSSDNQETEACTKDSDILQLRLSHQIEINNLMQQFHEREEKIRYECEKYLDTEKERLYRIIEQQSNTIANFQSLLTDRDEGYHTGMVAETPSDL